MNTARCIFVAVALISMSFFATTAYNFACEPRYKGTRISVLIEECYNSNEDRISARQARQRIREANTNSIPRLLQMVSDSAPSESDTGMLDLDIGASLDCVIYPRNPRLMAAYTFRFLGPEAKVAIPKLSMLLRDSPTADGAAIALSTLGPEAIPPLIDALTNRSYYIRSCALKALGLAGTNAEASVRILVPMLTNNSTMEPLIAETLGRIGMHAEIAVPALMARLYTPTTDANWKEDQVRGVIVEALAGFRTNAVETLGELERVYDKQDKYTQRQIAETIKWINFQGSDR